MEVGNEKRNRETGKEKSMVVNRRNEGKVGERSKKKTKKEMKKERKDI